MSDDQEAPRLLRRTIERAGRHLIRQRREVQRLTGEEPPTDTAALIRHIRTLETAARVLKTEREELNGLLTRYEQMTVDDEDQAVIDERNEWGDLVHDALGSVTEATVLLDELREPRTPASQVAASSAAATPVQTDVGQNLGRLVDLMTEQQQASTANRFSAGQDSTTRTFAPSKLPKIELAKFKDDVLKWRPFWDRFKNSVDKNDKLAPVDKMNYLVSLLEGESLKAVESLPLTDANYPVAVDLLKKRYGDAKLVISKLYRRLNEMRSVRNEPKGLRLFMAEIDCLMGSLDALGQNVSDDNFASIILSKLPEETVLVMENNKKIDDEWTVALVRDKLSEHVTRLERASQISAGRSKPQPVERTGDSLFVQAAGNKKPGNGSKHDSPKPRNEPTSKPKPRCAFCNTETHFSDSCKKYPDVESRLAKLDRQCYNCLNSGHLSRNCSRTKPCYYCKGKHHSALCRKQFGKDKSKRGDNRSLLAEDNNEGGDEEEESGSETGLLAADEEVLLQTALIFVRNTHTDGESVKVRALLDPGSNRSYCCASLASKLTLEFTEGPNLTVNRFGTANPVEISTKTGKITLEKIDGSRCQVEISVIEKITGNLSRTPVKSGTLDRLPKNMNLADTLPVNRKSGPIELLIGSDYYLDFIRGPKRKVAPGLYLLSSDFGWILTGRVKNDRGDRHAMSMCGFAITSSQMFSQNSVLPTGDPVSLAAPEMRDFWSLETLGIRENPDLTVDELAMDDFKRNVKFADERYEVSLPWNDRLPELCDDYSLSLGRFKSLSRRLKDDKPLLKAYSEVLKGQIDKGVIEKVEKTKKPKKVHYIPHHAVVKPDRETTKVRVVFDGSAKTRKTNPSLNECLFRGPILLEDLVGILLRFRLHPVALIADIEKAFLQIAIRKKDRDYTRFLWFEDPENPDCDRIQEYRFARVPFGLSCSPSLLAQTVQHHLKLEGSVTADKILSDLYVDNLITGVESTIKAKDLYKKSKAIFKTASMNLKCWSSNSSEFEDSLPPDDRVTSKVVKVLGLKWNTVDDTISVQGMNLDRAGNVSTRRDLLSALSTVFDPLGLYSPCTVHAKCLLQTLTKLNGSWDDPMPGQIKTAWSAEREGLAKIETLPIPRFIPSRGRLTLIAFTDASDSAFATAIYLRTSHGDTVSANLVFSKSRLNPAKKLTVRRLELMGNLIGKRALKFVQTHLKMPIDQLVLFSDSKISLSWIKAPKDSNLFVRNRVREIQSIPNVVARYVQTEQNPADWATRGKGPSELSEFWWHGPDWLLQEPEDWPTWDFVPFKIEPSPEIAKKVEISLVVSEDGMNPFDIDPKKYSCIKTLLHVSALCLRFVELIKGNSSTKGHLLAKELTEAKKLWEIRIQRAHFESVHESLRKGTKHNLSDLAPFVDTDGFLRVKGRLGRANLGWSLKFPKLMPRKTPYSTLLVLQAHATTGHGSVNHTLNHLRSEYWIPRGRSLVQQVIRKCTICRKATGKAYGTPPMPELPSARVTPQACFRNAGVDYFGPVKAKLNDRVQKVWVSVFTCLSTRAIHLEQVMDLSASEFLLALKRFAARRGTPERMLSDNAPQFKLIGKSTEIAWKNAITDKEISNYCAGQGISWSFIPEFAPYMGGVYERLVGVVKNCLRKTVGSALLTVKQLETLLCECEAIVNTRPLVYVGSDIELGGVLTPSHFLTLNPKLLRCESSLDDQDHDVFRLEGSTASELIEEWKKGHRILNEFWKTWSTEYLSTLRERSIYTHRHGSKSPETPKVGHVVLVKEHGLPRGAWKLARISELNKSHDNHVRSVTLRLPSGRELRRPLHLLIPIETSELSQAPVCSVSDDGRTSPEL